MYPAPKTRGRYLTTPAGTVPVMRNLKVSRIEDKSIFDKPMALAAADLKVRGNNHGKRPDVDHRSHDGQHAGDVSISEHGREDVG